MISASPPWLRGQGDGFVSNHIEPIDIQLVSLKLYMYEFMF